MDLKDVHELIKIVGESNLTSFEMENKDFKLSLKKEVEKVVERQVVSGAYPENIGIAPPAQLLQPPTAAAVSAAAAVAAEKPTVNSPIVGTFYAASSPEAAPFVSPGSKIKKGDTLCIVEAMKLMNEIEAEEDMEILEILVQNGQMVEFGQPLFAIRKL